MARTGLLVLTIALSIALSIALNSCATSPSVDPGAPAPVAAEEVVARSSVPIGVGPAVVPTTDAAVRTIGVGRPDGRIDQPQVASAMGDLLAADTGFVGHGYDRTRTPPRMALGFSGAAPELDLDQLGLGEVPGDVHSSTGRSRSELFRQADAVLARGAVLGIAASAVDVDLLRGLLDVAVHPDTPLRLAMQLAEEFGPHVGVGGVQLDMPCDPARADAGRRARSDGTTTGDADDRFLGLTLDAARELADEADLVLLVSHTDGVANMLAAGRLERSVLVDVCHGIVLRARIDTGD